MKNNIIQFIKQAFTNSGLDQALVGVSGGIDSGVVLSLLTNVLPIDNIHPILMPYENQDMQDAYLVCNALGFSSEMISVINIEPIVRAVGETLGENLSSLRTGNIMARSRMMVLFDQAKKHGALVVGTENKTENVLGYFTRFGDSASDLEPIANLYKTDVRQLARDLKLPEEIVNKPPSAGLWAGQTDETEFGFSYDQADELLGQLENQAINRGVKIIQIVKEELSKEIDDAVRKKILKRVNDNWFKQEVPYKIE